MSVLKGVTDQIWIKTTAKVRQDKGRHIDVPFELRCNVPSVSRIRELREAFQDPDNGITDESMFRELVTDWDMPGGDGNKVEFSDENIDLVLDHPDYLQAVSNALLELLFGKEALRAKNSMTRGAPGRASR